MTITIDLLSLILGLILGCCFMGFVTTFFYFDDRWHTAFGQGWECGNKYQKEQQNKADAEAVIERIERGVYPSADMRGEQDE